VTEVFRFLHLADVHLDTPYRARSAEQRRQLREAGWSSFEAALDFARERACDAVLIAGDLFDEDRVAPASETRLLRLLAQVAEAGIAVFLATGNHDPGGSEGRLGALRMPAGVTCFSRRRPAGVAVERAGRVIAHVLGVGHESAHEAASLADFPPRPGPEPTVGLMHALVTSARGAAAHDRYAPCDAAALMRFEGDYWALGHVHTRQCVGESPVAHYPGNLQGRHFGETGARGGLLVKIPLAHPTRIDVTFQPFAQVRWEKLVIEKLAEVELAFELGTRVVDAWTAARAGLRAEDEAVARFMLRVELRGACPLARELADEDERREFAQQLASRLGDDLLELELDVEGLRMPLDLARHRERDDLLGLALRQTEERGRSAAPWEGLDLGKGRLASRAAREEPGRLIEGIATIIAEALAAEDGD
jgi:DNA repair protein SbcD/Mre11